ncbi:nitrogen permease regulator 3 family protein [Aspergillus tanneri]|uniref:Nitrogen permease regulator 3 n=1 Tax=Aspergillus tanneri TaxID=1220188 RepID=A0A5M9NCA3_9EURO|nr:Nitrogen permease regulator 3 [Aspergillus tanneri]KAA8652157.1 Nitrogen permease regulator 3 [Aspergillus tanneri]
MSSIARPPDPCLVAIVLIVRSRAGPRFVFHYPPNPLSENGLRSAAAKARRASRTRSRQGSKSNDSISSEDSRSTSDEDEEEHHTHSQNPSVTHLAGSAVSATTGRRSSNFGLDNHGSMSVSPGGDSQRAGSVSSNRKLLRKRGGASDVEDDPGAASDRPEDGPGGGAGGGAGGGGGGGPFRPPWESMLGLPADVWEKLLSPSRSWHKRRFEVGINDLAFVGWPVFVREEGTWRKRRRKQKKPRAEWEGGELGHNENVEDTQDDGGDVMAASSETLSPSLLTAAESQRASIANSRTGWTAGESLDVEDKDSMTMFNVVFVLDPPLLEYSMRIREVYDNIIKKFAKALKWEQARTDYVWREAQNISHLKEKAKEKRTSMNTLYSELISQSSLARAIYTVYSSISASKIASVSLSPDVSISLQIPPLTSTPYLPGPTDKAFPGLWLTTADSVTPADDPAADENAAPHQVPAKHFALLLLDNEATILKDVESSGGALAPALAHYIRCTKPTKSFAQISASSGIPLSMIQMLASHLVYWRRARAIPPIHQRDTFIVSPNCDLSKLEVATAAYQAAFPTLPSLPKMLSAMSGTPRPYGSFIPSKDHKETYFAILAWLLRGGWVTQLRSFARVKVTPEIKMAVETALRREEIDKYLSKRETTTISSDTAQQHDDFDDTSSSSSSSLASQGSGEETPIPGRNTADTDLRMSHSLLDRNTSLKTSSLILFPHRASPLESRWLDEIVARFPQHSRVSGRGWGGRPSGDIAEGDPEYAGLRNSLKEYWPIYIKYFNGYDALEKIPVRENLKRKLVWQVLTRLGLVTSSQPSIELDPAEQVLVSVRHW